jgi:succinyl-CoA synthetase beta subunit
MGFFFCLSQVLFVENGFKKLLILIQMLYVKSEVVLPKVLLMLQHVMILQQFVKKKFLVLLPKNLDLKIPLIVRLEGTNAKHGVRTIN